LFLQSAGKHDAIKKRLIRALTCDGSIMLAEATDCDSWQQQQQQHDTSTLAPASHSACITFSALQPGLVCM
jgi:hypothetical protein